MLVSLMVSTETTVLGFAGWTRELLSLLWQALARKGQPMSAVLGCSFSSYVFYYFYERNLASGRAQTEGSSALV